MRDYLKQGVCLLAMAAAGPALAQDAGAPDQLEEIVVTGSRIARPDYVSPSPTVSVGAEALANTGGTTLDSVLNQLPQFTPSRGATSGGGTQGGGGQGQVTANIRGLGPQRTLVLLDGRRVAPSNADGTVDLNTIPDALIGSIEVVTGGASAAYGSDAVSGVLNFKLRRDLEGIQVDAKGAITEQGDGESGSLQLSWGGKFADGRGQAMLSLGAHRRDLIKSVSRDFYRQVNGNFIPPTAFYANDAGNPFSSATLGTLFAGYGTPLNATQLGIASQLLGVNEGGSLYSIFNLAQAGSPYGFANYRGATGPDAVFERSGLLNVNYSAGNTLQGALSRHTAFGRVEYEVAEDVTAYAQMNYNENRAWSGLAPVFTGQTFGVFIPFATAAEKARVQAQAPGIHALMMTRPNPDQAFSIYKGFTDNVLGARRSEARYEVSQFLTGLNGRLPSIGGTWELYASRGRATTQDSQDGGSLTAIQQLIANPDLCGGFNIFSGAAQPQACVDYIRRTARNVTRTTQDLVEANLQGGLFDLPAGEVRFAAGAGYRESSYRFQPDSLYLVTVTSSPQGPRNPATSDFLGNLGSPPADGSTDVYEAYGELLVPLLRDLPFVQELNLGTGLRYSHYDTVGDVYTYKGDLDWRVDDSFRFRGGYNRAVRAPSVGELYKAQAGGFTQIGDPRNGQGDPCSLSGPYRKGANAAQVRSLCLASGLPAAAIDSYNYNYPVAVSKNLSNPGLKEETADTWSVGTVWSSQSGHPLLSGLSASVDYYSIKIKDAIGTVPGNISLGKCFNSGGDNPTFSPDNFYCKLIMRDPGTGVPIQISIPTLNLATYKTSGIDFQVDWAADLDAFGLSGNAGRLAINALVNYLDGFRIQALPGAATFDYAGTIGDAQIDSFGISKPKWKATLTTRYALDPIDLMVRWRYVDAMKDSSRVSGGTAPGVGSVNYTDLAVGWNVAAGVRVSAGVDNLFDRSIPTWTGFGTTDPVTYDVLGRRFYLSARVNF